MTEPKPLPPDARAIQSQELVTFTCPNGHRVNTTFSQWDLQVLRENGDIGQNFLDFTCPICETPIRVEL